MLLSCLAFIVCVALELVASEGSTVNSRHLRRYFRKYESTFESTFVLKYESTFVLSKVRCTFESMYFRTLLFISYESTLYVYVYLRRYFRTKVPSKVANKVAS